MKMLMALLVQPSSLAGFGLLVSGLQSLWLGDQATGWAQIIAGLGAVLKSEAAALSAPVVNQVTFHPEPGASDGLAELVRSEVATALAGTLTRK